MLVRRGTLYRDSSAYFHTVSSTQINANARKACNKCPSSKEQTEELYSIRQGPDELFQDFLSRLMQASSRLIEDKETGILIPKQLASETTNAICKVALRSFRNKSNITDYIWICTDIGQLLLRDWP